MLPQPPMGKLIFLCPRLECISLPSNNQVRAQEGKGTRGWHLSSGSFNWSDILGTDLLLLMSLEKDDRRTNSGLSWWCPVTRPVSLGLFPCCGSYVEFSKKG